MKRYILFIVAFVLLVGTIEVFAAERPRIAVLRFTNHTHASWWGHTSGTELQDMLIAELASTKSFRVLERQELDKVFSEQRLSQSGLVDETTRLKPGKIKVAQYIITATVSAFQEDTSGSDAGLRVMGFHMGGAKKTAYMSVDLKVIDTKTAEIVDNRTIEATSSSGGLRLSGSLGILGGSLGKQENTPVGKAIRACVIEISEYLECSMTKKDECLDKYIEKEQKRREKTKKAIELDE